MLTILSPNLERCGMCLIVVAHQYDASRPLVVLANRDEFFSRPTAQARQWPDIPGMVAGQDLIAGGTWLGVRENRWAAVTNYREPGLNDHAMRSRGWLVRDYLVADWTPEKYQQQVMKDASCYAGFNLLLGADQELWYCSNRSPRPRRLVPGVYGLSNHLLDTPWPKVVAAKKRLVDWLQREETDFDSALDLMGDTRLARDSDLPSTGVPLDWERALSAMFICMSDYGTRSTSLLARTEAQRLLIERSFNHTSQSWTQVRYPFPAAITEAGSTCA